MNNRTYTATRFPVSAQHSKPPISFLDQLIDAIDPLPDNVFAENDLHDIYAVMKGSLGPYTTLLHRKAVMCEVLRVQAAFESDWNWDEGVDVNNADSVAHKTGQETGAFQVSHNSMGKDPSLEACLDRLTGAHDVDTFIRKMKSNHALAVEYCARLLRFSTAWCGTINNPLQVISHVRNDAVTEFQSFLQVGVDAPGAAAPGAAHALAMEGASPGTTGDSGRIPKLLEIATDPDAYHEVQHEAKDELFEGADEVWPHDGCAINLSDLLQAAGIMVPDIFQALKLGSHLRDHRGWQVIPKGQQQPGDVGSTCGTTPNHGFDHIYLVVQRLDDDEMVVADNQKPQPHSRFVSGHGRTPTKFFLRAT